MRSLKTGVRYPIMNTKTTEEQAELLKSVAHPVRIEILRILAQGPCCAGKTNQAIPISQPNLSQHLRALKNAGWIDCRIQGPKRCYFICRPTAVKTLLELLDSPHPYQPCEKTEQT